LVSTRTSTLGFAPGFDNGDDALSAIEPGNNGPAIIADGKICPSPKNI
jgi:hypothetical protein